MSASGALGGSSGFKGTINTAGTQSSIIAAAEIDLSAFVKNGAGVRVFVVVASAGVALCIGESTAGVGGWRVPDDDVSYELGIFDPRENIKIVGVGAAQSIGSYTIMPANR